MCESPMKNYCNLVVILVITVILCAQMQAQSELPLKFLSKQCNEEAIEFHLDPRPFQDFVGSEFSLKLVEGKACVLIIIQDCSQYWIDGKNFGPAQDIQAWVQINGVEDIRSVVGAQQTLPTRTWFTLFSGSSNPKVRAAKMDLGTVQIPIDRIFLDPPGSQRGGQVLLDKNVNISWSVMSPVTPSVKMVGVNHDVYTRDSARNIVLNRIQALLHVYSRYAPGTLKVVGESDAMPLIKPGTYLVLVSTFFPMWSRANLGLSTSTKTLINK
jgi:hypothetical protein